MFRDLTSEEHCDILSVIVIGDGVLHLLEVEKLSIGTGLQQAKAVVEALDVRDLKQKLLLYRLTLHLPKPEESKILLYN